MKHLQEILAPLAERLGWAWFHSLWQGAAIALVVALLLALLRRRSAAARHAVCLLGMAALVSAVIFTTCRVSVSHRAAAETSASVRAPAPRASANPADRPPPTGAGNSSRTAANDARTAEAPAMAPLPKVPASAIPWSERLQPHLSWITALWLAGIALLSLRQVCGWWRIRIWRRTSADAAPEHASLFARLAERFAVSGKVWLRTSLDVTAPILTGVLRPMILFPARLLTGLSAREVEAILAHELAHLARRDTWSNLAQVCVEILFFYHPVIWWLGRRARVEREHAADDLALRYCESRRDYAEALARLGELQSVPTLTVAASGGRLLTRIRRIVRPSTRESATGAWTVPVLGAALALTAIVLFRAEAAEPKPILVKAGESLQAAIDAAPAGATIQMEAGEWKERIVISKPLTLEGAGWDKTLIRPDTLPPSVKAAREHPREGESSPALSEDERYAQWLSILDPTIKIDHTEGVVVRGLKIQGLPVEGDVRKGLYEYMLVLAVASKASLQDCVMTGYYVGATAAGKSELEIRRCLLAGCWNNGAEVRTGGVLRILDSDVRNCYYAGVLIRKDCEGTVIEGSRISGSAWHGIRSDDASPTITGNIIFGNARSGIYSSGHTAATVRGNVFWRNEGEGMSCWFDNHDTIENNTFAGNVEENIAVLRKAQPTVRGNIFSGSPVGVEVEDAGSVPPLAENLFWENKVALQVAGKAQAAPEGAPASVPQYRDPAAGDFTLAAASAARAGKMGAADPCLSMSRWALTKEEAAIIPKDDTRNYRYWSVPGGAPAPSKKAEDLAAQARATAKPWVAEAFQLDDKTKRLAAIERVRQALGSTEVAEQRAGIVGFLQLGAIEFDKAGFRPLVRRALASDDVSTRAGAISGLTLSGADPEDLNRVFALADDPASEVRDALPFAIMRLTKGDLTDARASTALLKLMDQMPRDPRIIAHALWGARLSPELEARVLQYCRDVDIDLGYNFFYGTLSTQANKSEAVCRRLIEILAHPDTINKAGRAAWGLLQGVQKEQYPLVASAMLRVLDARSDSYLRERALQNLSRYASAEQAEGIKTLLAKPGVEGEFRKSLEQTLSRVERK